MISVIKIIVCISFTLLLACENNDTTPEFYVLNTEISNQSFKGFSFKKLNVIKYPNLKDEMPDFVLACSTNESGIIGGTFLSNLNSEDRFISLKRYDNLISAQNHYDTLTVTSKDEYQLLAMDINPFGIWQIKTNSGKTGIILVLEKRTETINNTAFGEIKFKARIIQ